MDENNPAAFPYAVSEDTTHGDSGMTLRDWFAGQALAGILGNASIGTKLGEGHPANNKTISIVSFAVADAMLEARKPKEESNA